MNYYNITHNVRMINWPKAIKEYFDVDSNVWLYDLDEYLTSVHNFKLGVVTRAIKKKIRDMDLIDVPFDVVVETNDEYYSKAIAKINKSGDLQIEYISTYYPFKANIKIYPLKVNSDSNVYMFSSNNYTEVDVYSNYPGKKSDCIQDICTLSNEKVRQNILDTILKYGYTNIPVIIQFDIYNHDAILKHSCSKVFNIDEHGSPICFTSDSNE